MPDRSARCGWRGRRSISAVAHRDEVGIGQPALAVGEGESAAIRRTVPEVGESLPSARETNRSSCLRIAWTAVAPDDGGPAAADAGRDSATLSGRGLAGRRLDIGGVIASARGLGGDLGGVIAGVGSRRTIRRRQRATGRRFGQRRLRSVVPTGSASPAHQKIASVGPVRRAVLGVDEVPRPRGRSRRGQLDRHRTARPRELAVARCASGPPQVPGTDAEAQTTAVMNGSGLPSARNRGSAPAGAVSRPSRV